METTHEIANNSNKRLEQRLIESINKLPNFEVNSNMVHDFAFTQPILQISKQQNTNLNNLLNEK